MAMAIECNGILIANTGIGAGHYVWPNIQSYLMGKAVGTFNHYSIVRGETPDKNAYNCGCVHVNLPHSAANEIDYIAYQNTGDRRYFGMVISREAVNENSCRIYFIIDWVATFADTIKFGKCMIERDSRPLKPYENCLPEPVSLSGITTTYSKGAPVVQYVLDRCESSKYTMICSATIDGTIEKPKMRYQAGGSIGGMIYSGDQAQIEEWCQRYTSQSALPLAENHSFTQSVKCIYECPDIVADSADKNPIYEGDQLLELLTMESLGVKNAKCLNYVKYIISAASGSLEMSPFQYSPDGQNIIIAIYMTGGQDGCFTYYPRAYDETGNPRPNPLGYVKSPAWPAVGVAGYGLSDYYGLNRGGSGNALTNPNAGLYNWFKTGSFG